MENKTTAVDINIRNWIRLGLFNLVLVALFGVVMRYKMEFNFPYFNQKFLLHAHSHFAFAGWVSHLLFVGLSSLILPHLATKRKKTYRNLILFNLFTAYGMLILFTIQGYKAFSIIFSTLYIFAAYFFTIRFIIDSKHLPKGNSFKSWAIIGLVINSLSSIGPFYLASLMATKNTDTELMNAAIYFYLHMQYNGWFIFGSMALLLAKFPLIKELKPYLLLLTATIVPTYVLSILHFEMPSWIRVITTLSTYLQLIAWFGILRHVLPYIKQLFNKKTSSPWIRTIFFTALFILSIKFILQVFSDIPVVYEFILSCRPIVIAYLHWVLLGGFTLLLLSMFFQNGVLKDTKLAKEGIILFIIGFILNELMLGFQSLSWISTLSIPYTNLGLFIAGVFLFLGALLLLRSQVRSVK